jgi:GxxExxY protein
MAGLDAAYQVYRILGPELLKTVYEKILAYEIIKRQLNVEVQNPIPLVYDDMTFDECFRADMILEKRVSQPAGGLAVVGFCALREARMV